MKALVTGANGFLGRHVVAELLRRSHGVRALIRPATNVAALDWPASVELFRGDLRASRDLVNAFEGVDVLIHFAAAVTGSEDAQFAAAVGGTERLLDAMAKSSTKRLVHASSCSVYDWRKIHGKLGEDSPLEANLYQRDGYAIAKTWQERVVRSAAIENGWQLTVIRPGFLWAQGNEYCPGIGQPAGNFHLLFGPFRELSTTHVENAASCFVEAAENPKAAGHTFNVFDAQRMNTWRYTGEYLRGTGKRGTRIPLPYHLVRLTTTLVQLASNIIFKGKGKLPGIFVPIRFDARFKPRHVSNQRLKEILNWEPPLNLAECLERTYSKGANRTDAGSSFSLSPYAGRGQG